MPELRIRFAKRGRAAYLSHLDVMRTFQRAFIRAGIRIRHSEGISPLAFGFFRSGNDSRRCVEPSLGGIIVCFFRESRFSEKIKIAYDRFCRNFFTVFFG